MRVLCVCTGNTCRSPMLEGLLRYALAQRGRSDIAVASAGIAAADGLPASEHAVACLAALGIDLREHRSASIESQDLASIDHFVCMGQRHAEVLVALGVDRERIRIANQEDGGVPDPFGMDLSAYQQTAHVLAEVAAGIADELLADTSDRA